MKPYLNLTDNMGLSVSINPRDVFMVRQALHQPSQEQPTQKWEGHSVLFLEQMPNNPVFVKGDPVVVAAMIFEGKDNG